jgi:uncharacterized protein (DUF885 family)
MIHPKDIGGILDSLATRFPVCLASDEFHFFPQARARQFSWSRWDDFSRDTVAETVAQLNGWEQQLGTTSEQSLSLDEQTDSSMMVKVLRTLREQLQLVRTQETQPTFYLTIIGIGLAEALEAGPQATKQRAGSLPKFIDQAIDNLTRIPMHFCEIGMEMLAEQRKWVESVSLSDTLSAPILKAMERLSRHLASVDKSEEFLPSIELYERIAAEHMGCGMGTESIAHELESEIEEAESILDRTAASMRSNLSWQAAIENLPGPTLPAGGILEMYRRTIEELSSHCLSKGMVTEEVVQQCPVEVEPIPDYLRAVRSNAAYSMPPAHPPRGGTFFIQDAKYSARPPADYRLLAAHETYPGHHLLDTFRWLQKSPARRHIEFPIFYEGWASFAEELMFETGMFSGPVDQMLMAKRRFWRAMRGKVDLEIHTRRRTLDEAAHLLVSRGMDPNRAARIVRSYSLKPGYQLAYTMGRRRFRALYAAAYPKEKRPAAFANRVLALGETGFDHLEQIFR